MVMEFQEFAEKFRERTAKRLLEFENKLEKAQQDLEKQAETQAKKPSGSQQRHGRTSGEYSPPQNPQQARTKRASPTANRISHMRDAAGAARPRQVKSVLRRGPG